MGNSNLEKDLLKKSQVNYSSNSVLNTDFAPEYSKYWFYAILLLKLTCLQCHSVGTIWR